MSQEGVKSCSICLNQMKNPFTLVNCNHSFCHSCITRHLQTLISQGSRRVQNFKCPQVECQKPISEQELEKEMDFQYFHKLTNKTLHEYSLLCPECRTRIDIVGNLESWRCFNCYTRICKFCKTTDHDGKCQTQSVYFNQVRTTIDDKELGYCPKCVTPFMKDENCDHVTCQSPQCCFQFCFFCSANYSPIYHHGGIYHRTDCRNYEYWQDFVPYYYQQCTECQKTEHQDGCPLPTQTKQDFLHNLFKKVEQKKVLDLQTQ